MKMLAKILSVGVLVAIISGCTSSGPYVPSLPPHAQALYKDYQSRPDNKVFVIAIDPSGDFAVGYDYGKATKKEAYKEALAKCETNRKAYSVFSKPNIYAINDEVVYEAAIRKNQEK